MGKLRKTIQRQVIEILDGSMFTSEDFDIIFGNPDAEEYLITIKFKHEGAYYYLISTNSNSFVKIYNVLKSPGQIEESENRVYSDLNHALNDINPWCHEIRNELKATIPVYKEMEDLKNSLYEHLKGHNEDDEFSVLEINKLKEKFEELEKRIITLEKENKITETQCNEFKEGLSQVSHDLEFYPKETWIKTATHKLTKLVVNLGKSPEGRKLISDGARKLLNLD